MSDVRVEDSILKTIKKLRGIDESDEVFDIEIKTYINSAIAFITQLEIGPKNGFYVEDENDTWYDLIGDNLSLNMVVAYIDERVHLMFDPPGNSFLVQQLQSDLKEQEFRMIIAANKLDREE